jgi:hypothetical protein
MNGQPSQVPPNRKTRRLKIIALIFIGLLALYLAYRQILARSIQARIDSIHQAGFPATCAELDKWYVQPPAGENAADVYSNAFSHFEMWTNEAARLPAPVTLKNRRDFLSSPQTKRDLLPIVAAKTADAQAALAVERYRLANGKLPDHLSDLVPTFLPTVSTDPFDGKPLRYKTLAKGYVVYSVGDDREDNGGTEKNSKGQIYVPGTDITFTVER